MVIVPKAFWRQLRRIEYGFNGKLKDDVIKGEGNSYYFGCIKTIPDAFYFPYFDLAKPEIIENEAAFEERLIALEIIRPDDTKAGILEIKAFFHDLLRLFTKPFQEETFDFSNDTFFTEIARLGESFTKNENLKKLNGNRGSKHFL